MVVKNTGDKPVRLWAKGDPVVLTLELKGEGAVNLEPRVAFTLEFAPRRRSRWHPARRSRFR